MVLLAFFAAVNGLAYVISLFFQTALGLKPDAAAISLSPLMVGIIIASLVFRPLIGKLGRLLVFVGPGVTLIGAAGLRATVLAEGTAISVWAMAPSILALRVGNRRQLHQHLRRRDRRCRRRAGRQRQRLAERGSAACCGHGSAVVTTIYFSQRAQHGAGHAMTVSVAVAAVVVAVACLGLAWLLPKPAPTEGH